MRADTHTPSALRSGERLGDNQIHWDQHLLGARASSGHPYPWLNRVAPNRGHEADCSRHLLDERYVVEERGVNDEVAVECVRGHSELTGTGVEVDGLSTNQDDRGLVFSEGLERVEEDRASYDRAGVGRSGRRAGAGIWSIVVLQLASFFAIHSSRASPSAGIRPLPERQSSAT